MNINVLTIFPEIFDILNSGVVSKAIKSKTLSINTKDIRITKQTELNSFGEIENYPNPKKGP